MLKPEVDQMKKHILSAFRYDNKMIGRLNRNGIVNKLLTIINLTPFVFRTTKYKIYERNTNPLKKK